MVAKLLPSSAQLAQRIYGLDILRCLAILFVLIEHSNRLIPARLSKYLHLFVFDGVTVFFVLSGFLIGSIFIKQFANVTISRKQVFWFWIKRWFRTLPAYLFTLLLLVFFYAVIGKPITISQFFHFLTFTQNLYYPQQVSFFPEAWSLAVEEWFYLLLPICVIFLTRIARLSFRTTCLIFSIVLIVAVTCYRCFLYQSLAPLTIDSWDTIFRKQVVTRLDSIMVGVLAAYIKYYHDNLWQKYRIFFFIIGLSISILANYYHFGSTLQAYDSIWSFTLISIGVLFILPYLSMLKGTGSTLSKCITFVSLISYSLYLLNFSLIQLVILDLINLNFIPKFGVVIKYGLFWVLSFGLSFLMYQFIEQPFMRLRDKITK